MEYIEVLSLMWSTRVGCVVPHAENGLGLTMGD